MRSKIFRRSISRDIVYTLTIAIILVSLLLAAVINQNYMSNAEKEFEANSRESIDNLASILIEPVWNVNSVEIDRLINLYIDKDIVAKISVFSNYYTTSRQKSPELDHNLISVSRIIKYNGTYIATLEVLFTKQPMLDGARDILWTMLLTMITVVILIIVLTRYLIAHFLRVPFDRLLEAVSDISSGNYARRIMPFQQYDINLLISKFNQMFQQLEERDKKLLASNQEITDLHHYLNNIIQSMPSAIMVTDENGQIKQLNTAALVLTDSESEALTDQLIWNVIPEFSRFHPAFEEVIGNRKQRVFLKEIFKKFESRYFSITLFPLSGAQKGVVFRIDDTTELEKIEEQLRQAQKMETVGNLAGGLAHDFNNVLGGIIGTTSVIKFKMKRNPALTLEEVKDNLEVIEQSGQRATELVQQLLALSRKAEMTMTKVNLNQSLKHVSKICQNTFDKSRDLPFDYSQQPPIVKADPLQIEQVILNLCVNSAHAMTMMRPEDQPQGGFLSVRIERVVADKFFCSMHQNARIGVYWLLMVADNGVGIDRQHISRIFDPFFTTKPQGKGTGLGLSMVYNIIMQHNGFIEVNSEPGVGTTFAVYLPMLDESYEQSVNATFEDIRTGDGLILVVDDEPVIRQTAKTILEECGYHVLLAENGEEGVRLYKKHLQEIDLVILDMVMPKKSGREAFIEMKQINPEIKVLLASGFRQDDRVQEVLNLGVKGFLQKPFTLQKLSKAVHEIFSRKEPETTGVIQKFSFLKSESSVEDLSFGE